MAATLGAFVFVRLAVIHWIRPHLIGPAHLAAALDPVSTGYGSSGSGPFNLLPAPPNIPNAWIYSTGIVDQRRPCPQPPVPRHVPVQPSPSRRRSASGRGHASRIPAPAGAQAALQDCVTKVGATFHEVVTYQPGSRYWAFQWYELAIYAGVALILTGTCIWWVRRRLS